MTAMPVLLQSFAHNLPLVVFALSSPYDFQGIVKDCNAPKLNELEKFFEYEHTSLDELSADLKQHTPMLVTDFYLSVSEAVGDYMNALDSLYIKLSAKQMADIKESLKNNLKFCFGVENKAQFDAWKERMLDYKEQVTKRNPTNTFEVLDICADVLMGTNYTFSENMEQYQEEENVDFDEYLSIHWLFSKPQPELLIKLSIKDHLRGAIYSVNLTAFMDDDLLEVLDLL